MDSKFLVITILAFLALSSFLMMGGIGMQLADASGPNCPSKSGAATTVDPNAPNTANTQSPSAVQPTV
ncbi:MAG TPA: hypothetical protein VJ250_03140 [Nitrososphaeraceae archaeon]|nr:hypothetical protein [Nitrososphaeraceae archaeon]